MVEVCDDLAHALAGEGLQRAACGERCQALLYTQRVSAGVDVYVAACWARAHDGEREQE